MIITLAFSFFSDTESVRNNTFYFNNWVVLSFKYKETSLKFMSGRIDSFKFSANLYKEKKPTKNPTHNKMGKKGPSFQSNDYM